MSVPATMLLFQVARGSYKGGGGLPPEEDKRTEKQKRRARIIAAVLIVLGVACGAGLVWYLTHSYQQTAQRAKFMFAPSPKA